MEEILLEGRSRMFTNANASMVTGEVRGQSSCCREAAQPAAPAALRGGAIRGGAMEAKHLLALFNLLYSHFAGN